MVAKYQQAVRVYADTSVFGGVFDERFSASSRAFFELVKKGRFKLVTSPTLNAEIASAPGHIRDLYQEMLSISEYVGASSAVESLHREYILHGILSQKWEADALHVASAVVAGCRLIVSWNFRHIVHFEKIPLYNAVNVLMGYGVIAIHSPLEAVESG